MVSVEPATVKDGNPNAILAQMTEPKERILCSMVSPRPHS